MLLLYNFIPIQLFVCGQHYSNHQKNITITKTMKHNFSITEWLRYVMNNLDVKTLFLLAYYATTMSCGDHTTLIFGTAHVICANGKTHQTPFRFNILSTCIYLKDILVSNNSKRPKSSIFETYKILHSIF